MQVQACSPDTKKGIQQDALFYVSKAFRLLNARINS